MGRTPKVLDRLIEAHEAHPEFCDLELARAVPCHTAHVRRVAAARGWTLPSRAKRQMKISGGNGEWGPSADERFARDVDGHMSRLGHALAGLLGEAA